MDIKELDGIGPATAKRLAGLDIHTTQDLIEYYPRKYKDYSKLASISTLTPGPNTIKGEITSVHTRRVRNRMTITEAILSDDSGSLKLIWFNQPYRQSSLKAKQIYFVSGEYEFNRGKYQMVNPTLEVAKKELLHTARIVPIYPQPKGVKSFAWRKYIRAALKHIPENDLPEWLEKKLKLMPYAEALENVHFPEDTKKLEKAKKRLAFSEIFAMVLASELNRRQIDALEAPRFKFNVDEIKEITSKLPYKLTDDQRKVSWQAIKDMQTTRPMNRLVQGDVGSGKTAVAMLAAKVAVDNGYQVAIMAPTEILARQHLATFKKYFKHVELLVSSTKSQHIKAKIEEGVDIVIGTHALIQPDISFKNLGLVVIDEQHRFGVNQRQQIVENIKPTPHFLSMSATPIPRTLALTLYGELDISTISELPPNRGKVTTHLVKSQKQLYSDIYAHIEEGRQVYVVCPVIEQGIGTGASVTAVHNKLTKHLPKAKIAKLHGKMKTEEQQKILGEFKDKRIDILVATTVIEVGVDIPNATVMVIEGAERFGLAQIHQLRGRIRRSEKDAHCYLLPSEGQMSKRLEYLLTVSDGFKLAEIDMQLRGPGEIYGFKQHGILNLKIAKLSDSQLIEEAQSSVKEFLKKEKLVNYKRLKKEVESYQSVSRLN